MAKGGRPQIEIDWDQFDKLCGIMATLEEIAGFFDCSEDTIERAVKREHGMSFADYFGRKSAKGKISLRRKQFAVALAGNVQLLMWLGKQILAQKEPEKQERPQGQAGGGDERMTTEQAAEVVKLVREKK